MKSYNLSLIGFLKISNNIDYDSLESGSKKVMAVYHLDNDKSSFRNYIFCNRDNFKRIRDGQLIVLMALVSILVWIYLFNKGFELNILNILLGILAVIGSFFIGTSYRLINDLHYSRSLSFNDTNLKFKTLLWFNETYPIKNIFIREVDSETFIYLHSFNYLIVFKNKLPKRFSEDFFKKFCSETYIKLDD